MTESTTLSFEEWMANVDALCIRLYGLSIHDFPDCCYMDWYQDGYSPREAVKLARRAATD